MKTQVLQPLMYCNFDNMLQKLPPSTQTPILKTLLSLQIGKQLILLMIFSSFSLFVGLCLKLSESNCSNLSCLKTPKNVKNCFNPYSFFTHLMKRASLGQLALKGGTTLNQLPIGLHVKILSFNGRFEAYWATFWMLSWYQSIQNRWKFNICFNVWVVVGTVFAVRARKQRPPCFWPDFKPQNAIPPPSHHTGLLSSSKQYLIFLRI